MLCKDKESEMASGRVVEDIWKDHPADPFFWIQSQGAKAPCKVYYGRESWEVRIGQKESRSKLAIDAHIVDPDRVVSSIDITGPMDEILVLIEFAGYHFCGGYAEPHRLSVPSPLVGEVSQHLPTLHLIWKLRENLPRERWGELSSRGGPWEGQTRFHQNVYRAFGNRPGRHNWVS